MKKDDSLEPPRRKFGEGNGTPTPVFLPGESHWRRSLVGYSPRGRKESDTTEWLHFHFLMAPDSSTLAWKIPRMEEPGRLQSMGSLRVGHEWETSLSLFIFMHWRRKWHPTPVFLPGESHGRRSLVGYSSRGHKESDTTEWLHFHFLNKIEL